MKRPQHASYLLPSFNVHCFCVAVFRVKHPHMSTPKFYESSLTGIWQAVHWSPAACTPSPQPRAWHWGYWTVSPAQTVICLTALVNKVESCLHRYNGYVRSQEVTLQNRRECSIRTLVGLRTVRSILLLRILVLKECRPRCVCWLNSVLIYSVIPTLNASAAIALLSVQSLYKSLQ